MKDKTKYDRQLVVQFLTNNDNSAILDSSEALADAFTRLMGVEKLSYIASVVTGDTVGGPGKRWTDMEQRMGYLSERSRVYINGHGDWESQTIAGFGPKQVARFLVLAGMPHVKTICITACELGRDKRKGIIFISVTSFAEKFHAYLKKKYGIKCEVHAYALDMGVITTANAAKLGYTDDRIGRKVTFAEDGAKHHRPMSKRIFTWDGNTQVASWALGTEG